MNFLKLDLESYYKNATIRMIDELGAHPAIAQARFSQNGVVVEHLFTDRKPKQFHMTTEEMDALTEGWQAYKTEVAAYKAAEEARKFAAEQEARRIIDANHFDYTPLNILMAEDKRYSGWHLEIPALAMARQGVDTLKLPETLNEMLDELKKNVEQAERYEWTSHEWGKIIPSYRRAFPKMPVEIQQARKLLTEAGLTGWILTHCHADPTTDCWSFVLDPENQDSFALIDKSAAEMLTLIRQYAPFSPTDLEAMNIDQTEQGEPEEIQKARALLQEYLIGEWELTDCGPAGYSLHHRGTIVFLNIPAERVLDRVNGYFSDLMKPIILEDNQQIPEPATLNED